MPDLKNIKIGIFAGGVSSEREISLESAKNVWRTLKGQGYKVLFIDIATTSKDYIQTLVKNYSLDLVFIALHGEFGEDGQIQQILEDNNIAYIGSKPKASHLAMDKILAKKVFLKNNIPTPGFKVSSDINSLPEDIKFPLVIKPYKSGSSLGISIVDKSAGLLKALKCAFSCQDKVIIEDYIEGRELTVGILDNKALSVVEIIPKSGYYDFKAKYSDGMSQFIAPAKLSESVYRQCQDLALRSHQVLGCRHFSRVDLRLLKNKDPFILEINSIPGLTSHSLLPLSAGASGLSFSDLLIKMIELAVYEKEAAQKA